VQLFLASGVAGVWVSPTMPEPTRGAQPERVKWRSIPKNWSTLRLHWQPSPTELDAEIPRSVPLVSMTIAPAIVADYHVLSSG
jgi:hypothetical protein